MENFFLHFSWGEGGEEGGGGVPRNKMDEVSSCEARVDGPASYISI